MRKVSPGANWKPDTVSDFNAKAEAAEDYLKRRLSSPVNIQDVGHPVKVQNRSGAPVDRYGALSLDGTFLLDDTTHEQIWLGGNVETYQKRLFCVLLDPAGSGEIVNAVVSGVTPALIDVQNDAHRRASLRGGDDFFTSNTYGPVEILRKPDGIGELTCVVNLSAINSVKCFGFATSLGIPAATIVGDAITPGSGAVDCWEYDWSQSAYVPLLNSGGTQVQETVYNPWPSDVAIDVWLTYFEDEAGLPTVDNEACPPEDQPVVDI